MSLVENLLARGGGVVVLAVLFFGLAATKPPCKLYQGSTIKSVTPLAGRLYVAFVNPPNISIYSIPLAGSHISSSKRRIKFFGTDLRSHKAGPIDYPAIIRLDYLSAVDYETRKLAATYKAILSSEGYGSQTLQLKLMKLNDMGAMYRSTYPYTLLSDGQQGDWMIAKVVNRPGEQAVLALFPDAVAVVNQGGGSEILNNPLVYHPEKITSRVDYYEARFVGSTSIEFHRKGITNRAADDRSPFVTGGFGFIFANTLHYWNPTQDKVLLFELPNREEKQGGGIIQQKHYTSIPMAEYFACNESEWAVVPTGEPLTENPTSSPALGIVYLGITVFLVALLVAVVVAGVILLGRRPSEKKLKGKEKETKRSSIGRVGAKWAGKRSKQSSPKKPLRSPASQLTKTTTSTASARSKANSPANRKLATRSPSVSDTSGPKNKTHSSKIETTEVPSTISRATCMVTGPFQLQHSSRSSNSDSFRERFSEFAVTQKSEYKVKQRSPK